MCWRPRWGSVSSGCNSPLTYVPDIVAYRFTTETVSNSNSIRGRFFATGAGRRKNQSGATKTQSALLEAMEEHQLTQDGVCHALPTILLSPHKTRRGDWHLSAAGISNWIASDAPFTGLSGSSSRTGTATRQRSPQSDPRATGAILPPPLLRALRQQARQIHVADALLDHLPALLRACAIRRRSAAVCRRAASWHCCALHRPMRYCSKVKRYCRNICKQYFPPSPGTIRCCAAISPPASAMQNPDARSRHPLRWHDPLSLRAAGQRLFANWAARGVKARNIAIDSQSPADLHPATRTGIGFGVLLGVIWIGSLSYSLNLGYVLAFWLAACGLLSMFWCFS